MPPLLALRGKIFRNAANSRQPAPPFYLSIDKNKKMRVILWFFLLLTALLCSDSMFNLLRSVTGGSLLFLYKILVLLFLYKILVFLYLSWILTSKLGVPKIGILTLSCI